MKQSIILASTATILASLYATPASAADLDQGHFTLRAGVGLATILPYAEISLGYRLPGDDLTEVFVGGSPWGAALTSGSQTLMFANIGIRHHWWQARDWEPYVVGAIGPSFSVGSNGYFPGPFLMAGLGVDWTHFYAEIAASFPNLIQPEIGWRTSF